MASPHPITVSQLFDKCTSLSANVGSSYQLSTIFGTKALVDFGSAQVVTYGAFFGLINFFCDISGVYANS